jgi:aspartate/methionine/tyrosine aminotransferase
LNLDLVLSLIIEYGDICGNQLARKLIAETENRRSNIDYYNENNVFLTLGTTEGIDLVLLGLRLFLGITSAASFLPVYYSFGMAASSYRLRISHLPSSGKDCWDANPGSVKQIPRNQVLYLNNPNAITGDFISSECLRELFGIVREKSLYCIYDEITRESAWDRPSGTLPCAIAEQTGIIDRFFYVHGPSKDKVIPGARIGYLHCPHKLAEPIADLLQHKTFSHPSILSNLVVLDRKISCPDFDGSPLLSSGTDLFIGLEELRSSHAIYMEKVKQSVCRHMDLTLDMLEDLIEAHVTPRAGYSFFIKIRQQGQINQAELCRCLSHGYGVDIAPGPMFGASQSTWEQEFGLWIRINLSLPPDEMREGLLRLGQGLRDLL